MENENCGIQESRAQKWPREDNERGERESGLEKCGFGELVIWAHTYNEHPAHALNKPKPYACFPVACV